MFLKTSAAKKSAAKRSAALTCTATVAFTLAACASDSSDGAGANGSDNGANYVTANSSEPQNPLIPADTTETGGGYLVENIYSGLLAYDAKGDVHNEVAESIEANEDNTEFTVRLKDWTFADGQPVTANSFVDAWNYAVANSLQGAFFFEPIQGYEEGAQSMEGLKVIDDKTFTITLSQPEADFPQRLGYSAYFPLPQEAFDDIDAFGENPNGNGPYKLAEWNHNQDALLVPNEEYPGERTAQNDGVHFTFYAKPDAAYADLLAGNLDVLDIIPDSALTAFEDDLGDRAINQPYAGISSFVIPSDLEHFGGEEGKLRRQAISHAIDRQAIIDNIFAGTTTVATEFTSPTLPGYNASIKGNEVLEFDPELAKQLWAKADDISEFTGTFELSYNVDGGNKSWVDAVSNQIKNNLGIEAEGRPYPDFKSLRDEISNRTIDSAFRSGWVADYPSIGNFLIPLYATGGSSNDGDYSNAKVDALLKEAGSAADNQAAAEKYNEAQQILFEELPAIPLWYGNAKGGHSEAVDNVEFSWRRQPVFYQITKE